MYRLAQIFESARTPSDYVKSYCARLTELLNSLDADCIARIIDALNDASNQRKNVFFIANGGSSAVASHWVNDLVAGSYVDGQPGFRAYSLTDNAESVTALANDSGFDDIFAHQLRVNMDPGDVVFAMSVSGNSENIIRGVDYARANGAMVIGVCGFTGGRLAEKSDIVLHVDTEPDEYGPVEDIFSVLDHIVTGYLAMKRGRQLHHG